MKYVKTRKRDRTILVLDDRLYYILVVPGSICACLIIFNVPLPKPFDLVATIWWIVFMLTMFLSEPESRSADKGD